MQIYPAIDLKEGATVQLVGGDPDHERFRNDDPVHVAAQWVDQGAGLLHIVDLDAALGRGDNLGIIQRILRDIPRPVQLGGGLRHLLDIQTRLEMGVGRVIIGTQGIEQPEWFEMACDLYPGKVVLAIDARGDEVAVKGWQEGSGLSIHEVLDRVADLPLAGLLYTDIEIEGRMTGIQRERIERVQAQTQHDLIVSGGIATMEDLDLLNDLDVTGAVLGMSIYTGQIDLKQAIEHIEGREVKRGGAVMIQKSSVQWGEIPEGTPENQIVKAPEKTGTPDDVSDPAAAPTEERSSGDARARPRPATPPKAKDVTPLWGRRRRTDTDNDATDDADGAEARDGDDDGDSDRDDTDADTNEADDRA